MLNDRDYMRKRPEGSGDSVISGSKCLFILIAVNVFMFFIGSTNPRLDEQLVLSRQMFEDGAFWQPLSAVFMHANGWHIFFNMFSLYIFGSMSAPIIGAKRFLWLFLVTGVFGNLVWLASVWSSPTPYSICGASGAVMGVIIATAMILPNVEMLLLFIPFPIKLRTLAIVFIALEIFSELGDRGGNIAYLAHIGGFIGGYIFMRMFLRSYVNWDPLAAIFSPGKKTSGNAMPPRGWTVNPPPSGNSTYRQSNAAGNYTKTTSAPQFGTGRVTQKELDYLLDKLSKSGVNSLTETEMERLRQAREQMRGS